MEHDLHKIAFKSSVKALAFAVILLVLKILEFQAPLATLYMDLAMAIFVFGVTLCFFVSILIIQKGKKLEVGFRIAQAILLASFVGMFCLFVYGILKIPYELSVANVPGIGIIIISALLALLISIIGGFLIERDYHRHYIYIARYLADILRNIVYTSAIVIFGIGLVGFGATIGEFLGSIILALVILRITIASFYLLVRSIIKPNISPVIKYLEKLQNEFPALTFSVTRVYQLAQLYAVELSYKVPENIYAEYSNLIYSTITKRVIWGFSPIFASIVRTSEITKPTTFLVICQDSKVANDITDANNAVIVKFNEKTSEKVDSVKIPEDLVFACETIKKLAINHKIHGIICKNPSGRFIKNLARGMLVKLHETKKDTLDQITLEDVQVLPQK